MKISSQRLANLIGQYALEKKAGDVKVLDLRKLADVTDYFLICSAEVELQARAIADHIVESLKKKGVRAWHAEGYQNSKWILIDYVDVVVHIFYEPTRDVYSLERLWSEAPVVHDPHIEEQDRLGTPRRNEDLEDWEG